MWVSFDCLQSRHLVNQMRPTSIWPKRLCHIWQIIPFNNLSMSCLEKRCEFGLKTSKKIPGFVRTAVLQYGVRNWTWNFFSTLRNVQTLNTYLLNTFGQFLKMVQSVFKRSTGWLSHSKISWILDEISLISANFSDFIRFIKNFHVEQRIFVSGGHVGAVLSRNLVHFIILQYLQYNKLKTNSIILQFVFWFHRK